MRIALVVAAVALLVAAIGIVILAARTARF